MTKNQLISLSLKVLGIYAIIKSLPWIGSVIYSFIDLSKKNGVISLIGSLSTFIILVLAGSLLILIGKKIAQAPDSNVDQGLPMNQNSFLDLQELAFTLTGVFIFIISLPLLLKFISDSISFFPTDPLQRTKFPIDYILYGIGTVIQTIFGIWLFIGSKGFIVLWQKLHQKWNKIPSSNSIQFSDVQNLAFAIAGFLIFISSISVLFQSLSIIIFITMNIPQEVKIPLRNIINVIEHLIQAVFGLWLFLGTRSFIALWQKLKQRWNYERNMDSK